MAAITSKSMVVLEQGSSKVSFWIAQDHFERIQELISSFQSSGKESVPPIALYAQFLAHCTANSHLTGLAILETFCHMYGVPAVNIHRVVREHDLDEEDARLVLRAYYWLWNHSAASACYFAAGKQVLPALWGSEQVGLMAMFGGQPGTSNYLEEARGLLNVYGPILHDYVKRMSVFLDKQSEDTRLSMVLKKGLDVYQWLAEPDSSPDDEYLVSAPVSMPLAGLVQLMQVMVLYKTLGMTPGQFSGHFKAAVGHSQGIVTATMLSMLSDNESFETLSKKALGLLLLIGAVPQKAFPNTLIELDSSASAAESRARPMVQVQGLTREALEDHLAEFNQKQHPDNLPVYLAVANLHDQFIVAGTVMSTSKLVQFLRSRSASPDEDQSKVPFAKRKLVIAVSYVDITIPYHCRLLEGTVDTIYSIAHEKGWCLDIDDMKLPVRAADDSHDIRAEANLTRYLASSVCVLPVSWPAAISMPGTTHIVDFGTGGFSGFGQLARKNLEGRGIPVICAGALVPRSSHEALGTKGDLYQHQLSDVISAPDWLSRFGPRLVRTTHDGKVHIDTLMRRILGGQTVMVAGMTPTTANGKFVAAINNAGYYAEFAAGAMHAEADMVRQIKELAESVKPGQGITLNCIYLNRQQWSFQFPALLRLRSEGLPIAGLCIGGGVPSFDVALEIISSLREAGIRHVAFKPSTAEAIRHVVRVAQASDGFPVVLQWTGGRAGGHHSYEDFHQPILQTYAAIRACYNIALVAGSGFGDAEGTLPYITGDWSVEFGRAPMPFDGVLLGSRVMVAQEAGTSSAVKELIVAAQGLPDSDWHQTYGGTDGGVTSFTTEFGELNHILATRAAMFLRDMHATILCKPRAQHEALLLARKDEVIARLNTDYLRPWFGQKADGRVVDLEDMTYVEVVDRLVELMYVKIQRRWIHPTYLKLVMDFIGRVERRMCIKELQYAPGACLRDTDPLGFGLYIAEEYPEAATQLLASEDVQFFVQLCKRRGQKPVPFIPVLDVDFGKLLLKDMAGQSEDVEAVVGQDPQRVLIQQGAVAVRYSTVIDEPVKDILDGIYHSHLATLLERFYDGDESRIPVIEYIGAEPIAAALPDTVNIRQSESERVLQLPNKGSQLPEFDVWLQALAGPQKSWLSALLTTPAIAQGHRWTDNYVRQMLRPRAGRTYTVDISGGLPACLVVANSAGAIELNLECSADYVIRLTVHHVPTPDTPLTLQLALQYCPSQCTAPIHGSSSQDDMAVQRFFRDTWAAGAGKPFVDVTDPDEVVRSELTVTKDHSRALCAAIGNSAWQYTYGAKGVLCAPAEFTHASVIEGSLRVMQSSLFGPGQANVVHLSNKLSLEEGAPLIQVGDRLVCTLRIDSLVNHQSGKKLVVHGTIHRNEHKYATVESEFLCRSYFINASQAFERKRGQKTVILLPSEADVPVLEAKEWFVYRPGVADKLAPNVPIEFCLNTEYRFKTSNVYSSVVVAGTVTIRQPNHRPVCVADVDFAWNTCSEDPVANYLRKHKVPAEDYLFEDSGYSLPTTDHAYLVRMTAPDSNWDYARYSFDSNAFHLNPYIADYANLPGTITHGCWTSASTRSIMERVVAGGHPERIRMYQTNFIDMVLPQDELTTEFTHVGMKQGRMLIRGQTSKVDGGAVMTFTAEVEQPATAYVFTGLGSQEVGMGMDLYQQSPAARAVWDRANAYMLSMYDIDLLKIVRINPVRYMVRFNGRAGQRIRQNFLDLGCGWSGQKSPSLLSEITPKSLSYTFRSKSGLLNLTQLTQPAILMVAMASMADMRAQGLVPTNATFAGHSLGELCAISVFSGALSLEDALDIALYRGLALQSSVSYDEHGRSQYGMVAVNPSRVSSTFGQASLELVVDKINAACPGLLQVVNYNVDGAQYVAAGTLANLAVLRMVLDELVTMNITVDTDIAACTEQILRNVLATPIDSAAVRGQATVPLPGVEVPSQSSLLAGKVPQFREVLRKKLNANTLSLDALCGHYIPNVTAVPFAVTPSYFELVHRTTKSQAVEKVLSDWERKGLDRPEKQPKLAAELLADLLAYQLAMPVQWIKTQEHLFGHDGVDRLIEVGPAPILCGIAAKALQTPVYSESTVPLLHCERDRDEIYYRNMSDESDRTVVPDEPQPPAKNPTETISASAPPPAAPVERLGTGAAEQIPDVPLQAMDVVHVLAAFKLKRSLDAVSTQHSIKTLVAGKSTLQNEIVTDLQKEFGKRVPDMPEEPSLQELGTTIGTCDALGKCTQLLVARMITNKMPGGFTLNSTRSTLETAYGLGPQRQDAVLLVALLMEPASRLGNEADATAWLDKAAQAYAVRASISYVRAAGAAGGAHATGPVVSSGEMKKMQSQQHEYVRQQIEVLARYADIDLRKDGRLAEETRAVSSDVRAKYDALQAEMGDDYAEGVLPRFDARKARRFDSYWNWARQDAYEWIQQAMTSCASGLPVKVDKVRVYRLQVRADAELVQMLSGMAQVMEADSSPELVPVVDLVDHLLKACIQSLGKAPVYKDLSTPMGPHTHLSKEGEIIYQEVPRSDEPTFAESIEHMRTRKADAPPLIRLCERASLGPWEYSEPLTEAYFDTLSDVCAEGLSFAGKTALVTGCGRGSIGAGIVCGLLLGGAKVLATTSSYSRKTTLFFEGLYRKYGARGSELILVPFNQGSVQDVESLVNYIFGQPGSDETSLGWELDYVFPFGVIADFNPVANIGSRSELAQRIALTNVIRLLGRIKAAKEVTQRSTVPALVIVPLSPNRGIFGNDGLYGECKVGLELTLNHWRAEGWEGYLSIVGAVIGFVRGTSLSGFNSLIMGDLERRGARTFSTREMVFDLLGLLHPDIAQMAHQEPVWAELDGAINSIGDTSIIVRGGKGSLRLQSRIARQIIADQVEEQKAAQTAIIPTSAETDRSPLAKHRSYYPKPTSYDSLENLHHLQDMVNLDKVVVITGYGEVSPQGNAETRWEVEAFGQLSTEGCIELAWIMGLIRHHNGQLAATGEHYVGWVDSKSGEAVRDVDMKGRYEEYILAHTGIRLIEPGMAGGYDPSKKQLMREIQIQHDMAPFEASTEDAVAYKKSNGDSVDIWENANGSWSVRFLKGALIRVPAADPVTHLVAGLLPTGWSAERLGIPEDLAREIDPVTLYTLVATIEALARSGITDPYQLYQHFHVTEVGNTIGSGTGGVSAFQDIFKNRALDKEVQSDILKEAFISSTQAWVNMLLMSGAGPVKPAVGACATVLVSIDMAVETIQTGKAKVMLAGGVDNVIDEVSTGFASMGATSNSIEEFANGRTPAEMSRPCTSTRNGFVEGQGAGVVVLMSAAAALRCGAPIYGVVGMTATATDGQGRSIPAPGKGILSSVREAKGGRVPNLLDLDYRRSNLQDQLQDLEVWRQKQLDLAETQWGAAAAPGDLDMAADKAEVEMICVRQRKGIQDMWGNEFWKQNPGISPLRGSLAVWGLTADDIGLASFHGTSTKANDQNESEVLNTQLRRLGRTPGHVLPAVCQKWLTGHLKGGAASTVVNGVLQSLRTGIIPGNRNADNIEPQLKACDYSLYLSQTIQTGGIRAGLVKSFGFGQVGGEMLVIHPDYVLATLTREQLEAYNQKLEQTIAKGNRYWQDVLVGNRLFIQVKDKPPYAKDQEEAVLLDPQARTRFNKTTGEYQF